MGIESYQDLDVWRVGMAIAHDAYVLSRRLPREEMFGLTSQIRRAAISVPANIAEGYGRETTGDYVRSLRIAQGSLKELETHVLLAERIGLFTDGVASALLELCDREGRMLRSLLKVLHAKIQEQRDG